MTAASTLEYGQVPRRRMTKWVVAVLFLALVATLWYFRAPLRSFAVERYHIWQFSRAFDRVGRALDLESGIWHPSQPDVSADQHLRALLALSPTGVAMYRGDHENTVLFVRAGQIGNRRWLAFACMSVSGLDVFTFARDDARAAGHHRPLRRASSGASVAIAKDRSPSTSAR